MNHRNVFHLCRVAVLSLIVASGNVVAQTAAVDGVKAASAAFYQALMAKDRGVAMAKVWAQTPYVTYVGPSSKAITVGWTDVGKYWQKTEEVFAEVNVKLSDQLIHVNGELAWEMGQESGTLKFVDGRQGKIDFLVTNVYEKLDGRWVMVSHHVQPKPK